MTDTRPRLLAMLAAAVLASVLLPAQSASADYVYQGDIVDYTPNACIHNRSEISHGSNTNGYDNGYSKGDIKTLNISPTWSRCEESQGHAPYYVYQHGSQIVLYHKRYAGSAWAECTRTTSEYRTGSVYSSVRPVSWNRNCGPGFYGTYHKAVARQSSTESFNGGWMWSGEHTL